jgi:hypothetical protein
MKRLLLTLIASLSVSALAEPAPWYWWASKIDGKRSCAQSMPERGWTRVEGPFKDARCEKPLSRK